MTIVYDTWSIFPGYWTYFVYAYFLLFCIENQILHHKVNSLCLIPVFFLDNFNEWIHPSLSLQRFNILWLPSLLWRGCWIVYLTLYILPLHFQLKKNLFMVSHIWVKYNYNAVLHSLPKCCISFTQWLTIQDLNWNSIFKQIVITFAGHNHFQ